MTDSGGSLSKAIETEGSPINLVAVLGLTASGKSQLAIQLAKEYRGELINCDASALYRELSVGVTKPSRKEREEIPYHLLDVTSLEQGSDLVDYLQHANRAIRDIDARGHLPIVVGGTGLYARALLDGFQPNQTEIPTEIRNLVRDMDIELARRELEQRDPESYERIDKQNPRRVMRALELTMALGAPVELPKSQPRTDLRILRIYLLPEKAILDPRIRKRTEKMWEPWVEEVDLLEKKGLGHWISLRKPIGYRWIQAFLRGELTREEALGNIVRQTVQLAKRQRTWLRREKEHPHCQHFYLENEKQRAEIPKRASALLQRFLGLRA